MTEIPKIVRIDGRPRLLVAGRPFLILGLQWACESCFSAEEMNPLFPHAAQMGCNTAVLPTYWREVEPEPGRFDFALIDERIERAWENGLRLVLLWFATWKNAHCFYAPDYIRNDPQTYPRALDRDGQPTISLCPSSEVTWQRDRQALVALMAHLRDADAERRVIMVQLENEPGIIGSARCYCPTCEARFAAGDWETEWGVNAAEAFSVASIFDYIDRLAVEAKAVYPLPLYANVWTSPPVGGIPGQHYPSGGGVATMLPLALRHAPHLDVIAPDVYRHSYREFGEFCRVYSADGNPLYIAEHSSSPTGRAERNVFYAVGDHGAIGFDPWAIDSPFPERDVPPLVDPIGGEWGPQAYWLRDSYRAIRNALEPIVEAQGTSRMITFVQDTAESSTGWEARGCDVLISYRDQSNAGRGIIIQKTSDEFLLIGTGFSVRFLRPHPDGRPIRVLSAEWGRYEGDAWVGLHPMEQGVPDPVGRAVTLLEPGVVRVVLST